MTSDSLESLIERVIDLGDVESIHFKYIPGNYFIWIAEFTSSLKKVCGEGETPYMALLRAAENYSEEILNERNQNENKKL